MRDQSIEAAATHQDACMMHKLEGGDDARWERPHSGDDPRPTERAAWPRRDHLDVVPGVSKRGDLGQDEVTTRIPQRFWVARGDDSDAHYGVSV